MSLTSWLFGKKKSPEEPPLNSYNNNQSASGEDDSYIFIERKNVYPVLPTTSSGPPELPYPVMATSSPSSKTTESSSLDPSSSIYQHPLDDVPFQLNRQLLFTDERLEQDQKECRHVKQLIKDINSIRFNYNFEMERGVLTEMDSMHTE